MSESDLNERVARLESNNKWLKDYCSRLEKKMDRIDTKVWGLLVTNITLITLIAFTLLTIFRGS